MKRGLNFRTTNKNYITHIIKPNHLGCTDKTLKKKENEKTMLTVWPQSSGNWERGQLFKRFASVEKKKKPQGQLNKKIKSFMVDPKNPFLYPPIVF